MRLGAGPPVRRADAAAQDDVRRANLSAVLRLLHFHGPATRSDLVASTGFNRSTVGSLTSELVKLGLVRERPGVVSGKGRPSNVVEPVSTSVHVLAFDVTPSSVGAARVGLGGYMLQVRRRLHSASPHDVPGGRRPDRDPRPGDAGEVGPRVGVPGPRRLGAGQRAAAGRDGAAIAPAGLARGAVRGAAQ